MAGSLAAKRITQHQLETLKQIFNKVKELEGKNDNDQEMRRLTQCEFEFHNTLYEATHNQKLKDVLHELHGICARFWFYWVLVKEEIIDQFRDARELLEALAKRDSQKSAELLRSHVQHMADRMKTKVLEPFPK